MRLVVVGSTDLRRVFPGSRNLRYKIRPTDVHHRAFMSYSPQANGSYQVNELSGLSVVAVG